MTYNPYASVASEATLADSYLESQILGASPLELVVILYRGAVDAVRAARSAIQERDVRERNHQIVKAHELLSELARSLDHQRGGDLSRKLADLYDYLQRRLLAANVEQSAAPLDEVERLLNVLLEGWTASLAAAPEHRSEPREKLEVCA